MDSMLTPTFQLSLLGAVELSGPAWAIHLTSKKLRPCWASWHARPRKRTAAKNS